MALPAEGGGIRGDDVRAWLRSRGVEPTTEGEAAMGAAMSDEPTGAVAAWRELAAAVDAWRRDRARAGARLRGIRVAAGLTQLDLAARSGVSHEAISRLELGRRGPRAETVARLADALEVAPGELADGGPAS